MCMLRDDNENKFQEVTKTVGGVTLWMEGLTHTWELLERWHRISREVKARSRRLLDDIKYNRAETENSLKEIRQDFSQLREELNSEQATWQNKAGRCMDKVQDSVRLVEERVARLAEHRVTEIQAAAQNRIQKVNTEIKYLRE